MARGLYAATTVAPPARVESRKTFPLRSSRMNAVVLRNQPVGDRLQVVDQVALGGARAVEQRLVEVGQRNPVPLLPSGDGRLLPSVLSILESRQHISSQPVVAG